uniref:Acyltransferase n=1 Tax=candidate division CPR3 bacterium TaxID=2268181 RepID=A0A7V3J989_UNCC3
MIIKLIVRKMLGALCLLGCYVSHYKWRLKLYKLGRKSKIFTGVVVHNPDKVEVGERSAIGDYVVIWGGGGVKIGNDVLIAAHSVIVSESHDVDAKVFRETHLAKSVVIEDNVWLGVGVLVMPGVTIGRNSVIGAGSIVTKNIPANSVAYGIPAKIVRRR